MKGAVVQIADFLRFDSARLSSLSMAAKALCNMIRPVHPYSKYHIHMLKFREVCFVGSSLWYYAFSSPCFTLVNEPRAKFRQQYACMFRAAAYCSALGPQGRLGPLCPAGCVDAAATRHAACDLSAHCAQVLKDLPAVLQTQFTHAIAELEPESSRNLLHPVLPSCLLASYLADPPVDTAEPEDDSSEEGETPGVRIAFPSLNPTELHRLSREAGELPAVRSLEIGCSDAINGCAMDSPAAALCHFLTCMPALRNLRLSARVSADVVLGKTLPLPTSLYLLDLTESVLRVYMGQRRDEDLVVAGVRALLVGLQPLVHLSDLVLPVDDYSECVLEVEEDEFMPIDWKGKVDVDFLFPDSD